VTGKTAGGLKIWQDKDVLSRYQALKLMTQGSAWMSGEEKLKGTLAKGQYADLVILPQDYFTMDVEKIKNLEASLTIVNGKVVYAAPEYQQYARPSWRCAGLEPRQILRRLPEQVISRRTSRPARPRQQPQQMDAGAPDQQAGHAGHQPQRPVGGRHAAGLGQDHAHRHHQAHHHRRHALLEGAHAEQLAVLVAPRRQ
jgi:hypothetical protein